MNLNGSNKTEILIEDCINLVKEINNSDFLKFITTNENDIKTGGNDLVKAFKHKSEKLILLLESEKNSINAENSEILEAKFKQAMVAIDCLKNSFNKIDSLYIEEISNSIELLNLNWPPCIDLTLEENKQITDILNRKNKNYNKDVEKIILKSYNHDKLEAILNRWKKNSLVTEKRFKILDEAIWSFKNAKYYSCVALITTQYGWIIEECEKYIKKTPKLAEKIKYLEEHQFQEFQKNFKGRNFKFKKGSEKHTAERNQLILSHYTASIFNSYFKNKIYNNNKNFIDKNNPNRHDIVHGNDMNFGTKQKALKSIICMDSMIRVENLIRGKNFST